MNRPEEERTEINWAFVVTLVVVGLLVAGLWWLLK